MTTTTITLDDTKLGAIVSPVVDGYIVRLEKTQNQWPPYQLESWFEWPSPHGVWRGRFVLRDAARRIISFNSQTTSGVFLVGASIRYLGNLTLESLARGEAWRLDISDVPTVARSRWAA
jgi:hypothetical protein